MKELVVADGSKSRSRSRSGGRVRVRHELGGGGQDVYPPVRRSVRGIPSLEIRIAKGTQAWFEEAHICRSKPVSIEQKCSRMVGHICSSVSFDREK